MFKKWVDSKLLLLQFGTNKKEKCIVRFGTDIFLQDINNRLNTHPCILFSLPSDVGVLCPAIICVLVETEDKLCENEHADEFAGYWWLYGVGKVFMCKSASFILFADGVWYEWFLKMFLGVDFTAEPGIARSNNVGFALCEINYEIKKKKVEI